MIIWHRSWGMNDREHSCKTVREFIKEVIEREPDKENRYFRICLKNQFDGKAKMLLYYQEGILKSHHSTQIKFDYKDVLEWEIYSKYSMDKLEGKNIKSYKFDNRDEEKEHIESFYYNRNKNLTINLHRGKEDFVEKIIRESEESNIQRKYLEDDKCNIENIDKVLKILVEQNIYPDKEINWTSITKMLVEKVEELEAKIEWLEKR